MDQAAEKLGMDPIALRMKNYAETNQPRGIAYSAKHLEKSYKDGAEAIGWGRRKADTGDESFARRPRPGRRHG